MKSVTYILSLLAVLIAGGCGSDNRPETLARKHCASCHAFPTPGLLDKRTWDRGVLPEMALRMGVDISKLPASDPAELNEILKAIPPAPLVTDEEWEAIREYYLLTAPDSLQQAPTHPILPVKQFAPYTVTLPIAAKTMLTLTRKDPNSENIFVGTRGGNLYLLSKSWTVRDSFSLQSPPADIILRAGADAIVACMGIMDPNDLPAGSVRSVAAGRKPALLADSLKRPVDIQAADLNNDGEEDLVVSAFGNFTGGLLALEKNDEGYRRHVIHNFAGTRKTIIRDFNSDGLPDILALITQGDEHIALLTNRGKFKFSYQVLLKFPPVYGSSYFTLCDFNGDGNDDILYTNGDNADYSAILKPYHGVRIFLNDGKDHFSESWFYPMNGASMARAFDFDEDGDLDIAAISFFPDFRRYPQRGFLYFENDKGSFTAFETPSAASSRWITMETLDVDDDRDEDLILAALAFPTGVPDSLFNTWSERKTSLLVLRNNLRP